MLSKSKLAAAAVVVAAILPLSACGGDPTSGGGTGDASSPAITIGSANFPENQLLAEMYAQALEAKDVQVTRKFNIGARELYLKALKDGSIDMIPEYNGALLAALSPNGEVEAGRHHHRAGRPGPRRGPAERPAAPEVLPGRGQGHPDRHLGHRGASTTSRRSTTSSRWPAS